jgi:hypothetical protein
MVVVSSRRCKPSQSVWVPGSPSLLRPRKPPKLATPADGFPQAREPSGNPDVGPIQCDKSLTL